MIFPSVECLDETLVMVSSEFGRTPKINKDAGRDHWAKVFSVMLAGGGIKGGVIHGASDATAAEPEVKTRFHPPTCRNDVSLVGNRLGQGTDGSRRTTDRNR